MASHVFQRIKVTGDIVKIYNYKKGFFTGYNKSNEIEIENTILNQEGSSYVLNEFTGELLPYKEGYKYIFNQDGTFEEKEDLKGRQLQGTTTQEEYLKRRKKTLNSDKNKIMDLINTNVFAWKDHCGRKCTPKFLTLTFKENIQDLTFANKMFKKYIMRLNYFIQNNYWHERKFEGLKYVSVVEFQKRGAIHYHILLFNMPYIHHKFLLNSWGHGGVYIEGFVRNDKKVSFKYSSKDGSFVSNGQVVKNVGAYITKTMNYMVKNLDDDRLKGKKCYSVSKGLLKPLLIDLNDCEIKKEVNVLGHTLTSDQLVYINAYDNEYVGLCLCREYNIKISENKIFKFKDLSFEEDKYISAFYKKVYEN